MVFNISIKHIEKVSVKVTDFGLARRHDNYYGDRSSVLPYRWLPPESLIRFKFDEKTDVWGFGVLLWELYALGELPYREMKCQAEVERFLLRGQRLQKQALCPPEIFKIMQKCWSDRPRDRPGLKEVRNELRDALLALREQCEGPDPRMSNKF